jgi:CubicO group peptidase (beta-lactamase class C family)
MLHRLPGRCGRTENEAGRAGDLRPFITALVGVILDGGRHTLMSQTAPSILRADDGLLEIAADVLGRWPSAGTALAVVRRGGSCTFHHHGVVDARSAEPVDEHTVFRVGSVTKTFTAVALMQLWERGLVDLDAPVADYLRAVRLVPVRPGLGPVTCRHLLTHTAGIGFWPRVTDLLRPALGSGVETRRPVGTLAHYYRRGLPYEVEPGTRWMYSNHGFAVLGQVVEDVSGEPLDHYLREHVLDPLGMVHSDLVLSARVRPRLATGHVLRRDGLRAVPLRDVPAVGGGALYSTAADLARFVEALLGGGRSRSGSVLRPGTVELMFRPHFRPDPRIPGMGLAFHRGVESGHRVVSHNGVVSGFLAELVLSPDDGTGVVVLTNTGGLDGRGAAVPLGVAVLRHLLGLPRDPLPVDVPPRPEVWSELCGRYGFPHGLMSNVYLRLFMGAGARVRVRDRHLFLQPLNPAPVVRHGMRLHPDDPDDPYVFRVDLAEMGMPTIPVVFSRDSRHEQRGVRLCFGEMVFEK